MKPKILNKIKDDKYIMYLYTFNGGKKVTFFEIYVNEFKDENKELLENYLNSVNSSGYKITDNNKEKPNFQEGKNFKYSIKFILWSKDVRKIYDNIKNILNSL